MRESRDGHRSYVAGWGTNDLPDEAFHVLGAVQPVVAADAAVRRLVKNYDRARRSSTTFHATGRLLSATGMIPNELKALRPSPTAAFFAKPDGLG